jgi:hypothetical protein
MRNAEITKRASDSDNNASLCSALKRRVIITVISKRSKWNQCGMWARFNIFFAMQVDTINFFEQNTTVSKS